MVTTKIYRNDSKIDIDIIGIGVVPAGDQVSITGEYQPVVILSNYPGLVDVLAEEEAAPTPVAAPTTIPVKEEPTDG